MTGESAVPKPVAAADPVHRERQPWVIAAWKTRKKNLSVIDKLELEVKSCVTLKSALREREE